MKESMLMVRINSTMKKRLEEVAEKKGYSVSEFLRFLIMQELEKNKDE